MHQPTNIESTNIFLLESFTYSKILFSPFNFERCEPRSREMLLNCTPKRGKDGKFCMMHLFLLVFPVVKNGCENWNIKKAEQQRIDVFELWCWRRLLKVPWTSRSLFLLPSFSLKFANYWIYWTPAFIEFLFVTHCARWWRTKQSISPCPHKRISIFL